MENSARADGAAGPEPAALPASAAAPPWRSEAEEDVASRDGRRVRHDAFTLTRKREFLDALRKTACVLDACRSLGISPRTVYNHRNSDPRFDHYCGLALQMSTTELELSAWERGVEGIEEPVYAYGKLVGTRIKRSDAVLRMLMEGNVPEKYGRRIRFAKALTDGARAAIREEVEAEIFGRNRPITTDELRAHIIEKFEEVHQRVWMGDRPASVPGPAGEAAALPTGPSDGSERFPDSA